MVEISNEEFEELKKLRLEREAKGGRALYLKVSEKGGVSLYGLGRFPVTLYKEQWQKVLGFTDQIKAFLIENESSLKTKEN